MAFWEEDKLKTIWRNRQRGRAIYPLSTAIERFIRKGVIPRQKKLSKLNQAWSELLPEEMLEHSCLESFRGGQLRVLVDSAVHYSELNMLVRAGLVDEMCKLCPNLPISRIKLVRERWYRQEKDGTIIPAYRYKEYRKRFSETKSQFFED